MFEALSREGKQIMYCVCAYATQKAISLLLMSILPLAVLQAGGTHMQSVLVIGVYQIGISLTSYLSRHIFIRFERRGGYLLSILFFVVSTTLGLIGLLVDSATTLIVSMVGVGMAIGLSGTIRFAAMEVSKQDKRSKDKALTMVLTGGILSAAFSPLTASAFADLIPGHPYVGCYILMFILIAINLWLVAVMITFPSINSPPASSSSGADARKSIAEQKEESPSISEHTSQASRSSSENLRMHFVLAAASSLWANTYLMLIMSSVLTEMVEDRDFSLLRSSVAIFVCFMGRFMLGPWSGAYLKDHGVYLGQIISCICFVAATGIFMVAQSISLVGFIIAMTLTGFGWHFGFASGNLMLGKMRTFKQGLDPDQEHKRMSLHYQALHDFTVFFMSGLIVLLTGITNPKWTTVVLVAMAVTLLLMVTAAMSYYLGFTSKEVEVQSAVKDTQTVIMNPLTTEESCSDTQSVSGTSMLPLTPLQPGCQVDS